MYAAVAPCTFTLATLLFLPHLAAQSLMPPCACARAASRAAVHSFIRFGISRYWSFSSSSSRVRGKTNCSIMDAQCTCSERF